jgi:hypothetical protein
MSAAALPTRPFLCVLDYRVETRDADQVIMVVFLHEGQVFNFYMESAQALALAGELESAYQEIHSPTELGATP